MNRKPRPVSAPILSSQQWIRLTILGLLMAVGALIVRDRGEAEYDVVVGSTMLLTTLTFFHVFAGLSARDELGTIFSRASIPGWAQLRLYGLAVILAILATELGFLQRILDTASLTRDQWLICIAVASSLLVVEELAKFFLRQRLAHQSVTDH